MLLLISTILSALPYNYTECVQSLFVNAELMDHRERKYILARPEELENDLTLLYDRVVRLSRAPMLWEADRFPDRDLCVSHMAFNRSYRLYVEQQSAMYPDTADLGRIIIKECDALYGLWDCIRDAKCEYYYVTVRREALQRAKNLMSPEDWYLGTMPPYAPFWRFIER